MHGNVFRLCIPLKMKPLFRCPQGRHHYGQHKETVFVLNKGMGEQGDLLPESALALR
jgi:hypothetical protein